MDIIRKEHNHLKVVASAQGNDSFSVVVNWEDLLNNPPNCRASEAMNHADDYMAVLKDYLQLPEGMTISSTTFGKYSRDKSSTLTISAPGYRAYNTKTRQFGLTEQGERFEQEFSKAFKAAHERAAQDARIKDLPEHSAKGAILGKFTSMIEVKPRNSNDQLNINAS